MWFRRLLAQLTTPLIVALLWISVSADGDDFLGDFGAAAGLCYLGWFLIGFPGLLFRARSHRPSLWTHAAQGAVIGGLPFVPEAFVNGGHWPAIAGFCVLAGVTAALWYWLCAYWRPFGSESVVSIT